MIAARRILAWPLYLLAFIFHLLTAFFTWAAQYISGDDFKSRSRKSQLILIELLSLGVAVAMVAKPRPLLSAERLTIIKPYDLRGVKVSYNDEEMARVMPYIQLMACIFTQEAVRYSMRPARVSFVPCPHSSDYQITFSEDLIGVAVSGAVDVNGTEMVFKAALQHYPTATELDGFQVIDISVR